MMTEALFYFKAFVALFVLVNPLEGIPIFLMGTQRAEPRLRLAIARRASEAVAVILTLSALLGNAMLKVFGIGIGAFQVGGGVVLFLIAVRMVFGFEGSAFSRKQDGEVGIEFAVVPLAIPLMAGPGAITGAILYGTRMHSIVATGILIGIIALVGLATYGSLHAAHAAASRLKDTGISVATSVMGLIIAAIAVEMMAHGIALMFGLRLVGGASAY